MRFDHRVLNKMAANGTLDIPDYLPRSSFVPGSTGALTDSVVQWLARTLNTPKSYQARQDSQGGGGLTFDTSGQAQPLQAVMSYTGSQYWMPVNDDLLRMVAHLKPAGLQLGLRVLSQQSAQLVERMPGHGSKSSTRTSITAPSPDITSSDDGTSVLSSLSAAPPSIRQRPLAAASTSATPRGGTTPIGRTKSTANKEQQAVPPYSYVCVVISMWSLVFLAMSLVLLRGDISLW